MFFKNDKDDGTFEMGDDPGFSDGEFRRVRVVGEIAAGGSHRPASLRPSDRIERLRKAR